MTSGPQEVEIALLIAADDAPGIAESIAQAAHVAGYDLAAREDLKLHDVHYDTVDYSLASKGFALRTRLRNGRPLITLKGSAHNDGKGGVTRTEIEEPWSKEGFGKIAAELGRAQITLIPPSAFDDFSTGALRDNGLLPIQDRQTRRRVRDVLNPAQNAQLAELAIDAISYRIGSNVVDMYEVEIEAKQANSVGLLHACADALQADYGAMLRTWPYGKLATGAAISRLLSTGELTALLVNGHLIGAQACLLLEDRLRS